MLSPFRLTQGTGVGGRVPIPRSFTAPPHSLPGGVSCTITQWLLYEEMFTGLAGLEPAVTAGPLPPQVYG